MTTGRWNFKGSKYWIRVSSDGYFFAPPGLGQELWNKYSKMSKFQLQTAEQQFIAAGKKAMRYPFDSVRRKDYQTDTSEQMCWEYSYQVDVKEECLIIESSHFEGSVFTKVPFKLKIVPWDKIEGYFEKYCEMCNEMKDLLQWPTHYH